MSELNDEVLNDFFQRLAQRWTVPATLYLIGGTALSILGSPRQTLDVDYIGNDVRLSDFQTAVKQVAHDMGIEVEPVPLDEMIPLPEDAYERCRLVGHFGALSVYVFDPYSIALGKLDRGSATDLQDVEFLVRNGFVDTERLKSIVNAATQRASEFDIVPDEMREHLELLLGRL